ncbi:beta-1,4-galactosyltransferase galt-1-like isoform X2 [Patella vulgata]|uniref:beta-1,4-galactosyltransferase galt-1-like isoform X2 n=1 Tax=Patella vulgata TaxID=6465 RepID=UPI0021801B5C|nr:beta-1,4-galactosyltransferase galt-1-like isoform X2 [Patella vulgata]XP_055954254.1 beta-1,4-galactosyltransferase galt-1-like isoform X2 [Patella vulgata]
MYGAMMVTCDLNDKGVWYAVSVTPSIKDKPLNRMILHYPEKTVQRNFTLCLSVMHSSFGNVMGFVEALEFDKVLGANHFVIHHFSSSQPMKIVLNDYIKRGEVTLLNYKLPIGTKDVHYFGQIAAVNDCVYRSRGISRYVVVVDIDEILIPYTFNDWMEMMDNLTSAEPKASSFSFRTTFFDTHMPDDTRGYRQKDLATRYKLRTLLKVWRENYIFEYNSRCKVIGKPELIDVMAIHTVAKQKRAHKLIHVNYTTALLHHYRLKNSSPSRIFNDKTRQYSSRVVDRVIKRFNSIPTPCIHV